MKEKLSNMTSKSHKTLPATPASRASVARTPCKHRLRAMQASLMHPANRNLKPSSHSRESRPLHPTINVDEGGDEEGIGENPGRRVAEADGHIAPGRDGKEADQDTGHHLGHARKHGQIGETGSLNGVAQDAEQSQHGKEADGGMKEQHGVGNDFRLGRVNEQLYKQVCARHEDAEGKGPVDHHHQRAGLHALPDAPGLARPVILSGKGSHRHAQALEGTHEEHLDAHGSREGGHTGGAQGVVGALEHDAANGGDGELKSHGDTHGEQRTGQAAVETAFGRRSAQDVEAAHHVEVAQQGRYALGYQRGNGRTGHAPPQHQNAEEVEQNVEHGGEEQEPERRLAVAQRTDDAGEEVVIERAGDADEGDQQVKVSIVEDVFRRAYQVKNPAAKQGCDNSQRQGDDSCQPETDRHVAAHGDVVVRAELLRHGNAETAATAVAETQNEKNHRGAGTHRRQRIDAQELSHDGSIHHRVGLLQQVAHQQGQSEIKYLRKGAPFCHLHRFGHVCIFLKSGAKLAKKQTGAN